MSISSFSLNFCGALGGAVPTGKGSSPAEGASVPSAVFTGADVLGLRSVAVLGTDLSGIFPYLVAGGYFALPTTCKKLSAWSCAELGMLISQFYQCYQYRCRVLLDSDAKRHLFALFGIECPCVGAASPARMQAMVRRVSTLMASLAAFSETFPQVQLPANFTKFLLAPQAAERLVMQLPPERLQEFLSVAYGCNLYPASIPYGKLAPAPQATPLAVAIQAIRDWPDKVAAMQDMMGPWAAALGGKELSCIFSSLGATKALALSIACEKLGTRTCGELCRRIGQFYHSRCQSLLASDTKRHLFVQFGINCPDGGPADPERMRAMISRVKSVIASLEAFSTRFPEIQVTEDFSTLLVPRTAERLVLEFPPECLQRLLAVAYSCDFYTTFAPYVKLAAGSPIPLTVATQAIRRWSDTLAGQQNAGLSAGLLGDAALPPELLQLPGFWGKLPPHKRAPLGPL